MIKYPGTEPPRLETVKIRVRLKGMATGLHLFGFETPLPRHRTPQESGTAWLLAAHQKSAEARGLPFNAKLMGALIQRIGLGPERIAFRGHELDDFTHTRWEEMALFRLHEDPLGPGIEARTRYFHERATAVLARMLPPQSAPPEHLVHVTCTGYHAPSAAEEVVSRNGWGEKTLVTHAYHMGCYASIPAIRMAGGSLLLHRRQGRAVIAHTELCSVHLDPSANDPEQLVVQSLFADGFARYEAALQAPSRGPFFEVLALREEIGANSLKQMVWSTSDRGMKMGLSREVPSSIQAAVTPFVDRLLGELPEPPPPGVPVVYAIHPGGPKVIETCEAALGLRPGSSRASLEVLREHGNMSSATLPHVWARMLADPEVTVGTLIVSLAFGPGLTLAGAVFRKGLA